MKKSILILFGAAIFAFLPVNQALAKQTTQATKTTHTQMVRNQWQTQTLSGKIAKVDSGKNVVIVKDSSGTPFDLVVTPSTRIKSGTERLKLSDLSAKMNDKVSVRYTPERKGDIAKLIDIGQ
jgi:hypothetical protein